MNHAVDYRADYYALGATFCEMLTGEPPFIAQDALELVHGHLARIPTSPAERRPEVPPCSQRRGNPFFTFQFIAALHSDGLVSFDHRQQRWQWDVAEIGSRNFTDNVVELMLAELQRLPLATREALALAGFLGNRFTRSALAIVSEQALVLTEAALRPALELGLLARGADSYPFLHDRVQEAANALTPPHERPQRHWQIGCRLHDSLSAQERDDSCFELAEHLIREWARRRPLPTRHTASVARG